MSDMTGWGVCPRIVWCGGDGGSATTPPPTFSSVRQREIALLLRCSVVVHVYGGTQGGFYWGGSRLPPQIWLRRRLLRSRGYLCGPGPSVPRGRRPLGSLLTTVLGVVWPCV